MSTSVAFVGAQAGDMAAVECGDGKSVLIDCSIDKANKAEVMRRLFLLMDTSQFDMFVALNVTDSRVQGLSAVNDRVFIRKMWDAGLPANAEAAGVTGYRNLRDQTGAQEIDRPVFYKFGSTRMGLVRATPTAKADQPGGPMILRIADVDGDGEEHGAVLFMSDASPAFWDEALGVLPLETLRADVLVAGGHGAFGLKPDASDKQATAVADILIRLNPSILIIADGAFDDAEQAPAQKALARFSERCPGAEIMRIGDTGPATFTLSPNGVSVEIDDEERAVQRLAS